VEKLLYGDPLRAGKFLLAMASCAMLIPSAFADSSNVLPDKDTNTGKTVNIQHDMTRRTVPSNSNNNKGGIQIDYASICIYCHLPNMTNHQNTAPQLNNTIRFSPTVIQKTNSEYSR
jgi:hypothetical protein